MSSNNSAVFEQDSKRPSEWSQARMIFGKLIGVDKKKHRITVEYKQRRQIRQTALQRTGFGV